MPVIEAGHMDKGRVCDGSWDAGLGGGWWHDSKLACLFTWLLGRCACWCTLYLWGKHCVQREDLWWCSVLSCLCGCDMVTSFLTFLNLGQHQRFGGRSLPFMCMMNGLECIPYCGSDGVQHVCPCPPYHRFPCYCVITCIVQGMPAR